MSKIQKNVLLAPFTTFKIGGQAKYFAEANRIDEIQKFCSWAKEKGTRVFILGGGSNVLISDNGFDGLVIRVKIRDLKFKDNKVYAGAGVPLAKLIKESTERDLSGLEWAIGIPGMIGGAVCGNAGAFGGQISDSIESVEVLDKSELPARNASSIADAGGRITNYELRDCDFGYRDSLFKRNSNLIVLSVSFIFRKENPGIIQGKIADYIKRRAKSSVGNYNCAGCFFKNIEWKRKDINREKLLETFPALLHFADKPKISTGFLIDSLGFKNKRVGDAVVSNDHANFILNLSNAKAEHILMLSSLIKQRIFNHYGLSLEEEVQLIGFD